MSGQRGSIVRVLRSPALRRVQLAFFGSTLGDWAYGIAVMVWAYDEGGAAAVGAYQALRFVVGAVAGPLGAHVADRVGSRKRYMMANDAIRAVQLYARAAADAVLEGKAAAPNSASVREEEFAEAAAGDDKPARRAPAKKGAKKADEAAAE